MQYMLLIYEDEGVYGEGNTAALGEIIERHRAFGEGLGAAMQGGAGLHQTSAATTVVTRSGAQTIHDGPFAETKEQLGGFYMIEAPDLDAAIAIARKLPLHADGSVEIRPVEIS